MGNWPSLAGGETVLLWGKKTVEKSKWRRGVCCRGREPGVWQPWSFWAPKPHYPAGAGPQLQPIHKASAPSLTSSCATWIIPKGPPASHPTVNPASYPVVLSDKNETLNILVVALNIKKQDNKCWYYILFNPMDTEYRQHVSNRKIIDEIFYIPFFSY